MGILAIKIIGAVATIHYFTYKCCNGNVVCKYMYILRRYVWKRCERDFTEVSHLALLK
jgi:hypothetical protein